MKSLLNLITKIRRAGSTQKKADALSEFEAERLRLVEQAVAIRPFFLPIQFNKTAVANNEVINGFTDSNVGVDLEILGGITDITSRDCQIRDVGSKSVWADKQVNIENFFGFGGNNANTTGRMGMHYYGVPYPLQRGNRLEVMPKNATGGAADIKGFTCFYCQRVRPENFVNANLEGDELEAVKARIKASRAPRTYLLRANVEFTAASATGTALNVLTEPVEEPVIVTGAYADNVFRSTCEVFLHDGDQISRSRIPAWAIFQRKGIITSQYNRFRPFYLPRDGQLKVNFYNGYDGANFDPVQNLGTGVIPNIVWEAQSL